MININYIHHWRLIMSRPAEKMDEGVGQSINIGGRLYKVTKIKWTRDHKCVEVYVKKGD